ncbi:MAG: polyprenyl synthetase family protein [Planctomycetes bacterium]|nr:polyprenyl synthetase family protein [Planctomycetota bacterium]
MPKATKENQNDLNRPQVPALDLISDALSQVRSEMQNRLQEAASEPDLNALLAHLDLVQGKMLRPALVLLSGTACGTVNPKHIKAAAIMEMIHLATLLHDDVLDLSEVRRHHPTVNALWGNESAVLMGDFILTVVFGMCTELRPEVARVIARTAGRVCKGEVRQSLRQGDWSVSVPEYLSIVEDKTASFFAGCCEVGAVLSTAEPVQVQALNAYGLDVGIAFQIADDMMDLKGDGGLAGKSAGRDQEGQKATLPVIHMLSKVEESKRELLLSGLSSPSDAFREALVASIECTGSLVYAQQEVAKYTSQGLEKLRELPESPARAALEALAQGLVLRVS